MSAREIYEKSIRQLPALDRLQLASLILDDLAAAGGAGIDFSDEWSDQDMTDVAAFSAKHARGTLPLEDTDG